VAGRAAGLELLVVLPQPAATNAKKMVAAASRAGSLCVIDANIGISFV
jgi:hypothetical protein